MKKANISVKKSSINYEDSDSSDNNDVKINEDKRLILPVFNENNIYLTTEFLKKTLEIGNINIDKIDKSMLEMFQKAFIHKSYSTSSYIDDELTKKNEKYNGTLDVNKDDYKHCIQLQNISNEVIEWLGDSVIQSVSAIYLYERFKTQKEGFLTKIRSKLVKTESLSKLSLALGFDKYIMISKQIEVMSNGRKNNPILEDCFEAFIGCMMNYFGSTSKKEGFDKCYTFIISIIEKFIDLTELIIVDDNFKDQLMRYFHKKYEGKLPTYDAKDIIQTVGNNGIINKKFHMYVKDINGKIIGEGISKSKKEAEQLAAKQALMYFGISNS
jgi:ribonuclease-3